MGAAGPPGGGSSHSRPGVIRVRRVYDASDPDDGVRILVDRLWPRGLSKRDARFDRWVKDLAPSNECGSR